MKKVLILSGSPRKGGNSDILCDQFAKGAQEAGNHVEKIRVADKKIGYCHASMINEQFYIRYFKIENGCNLFWLHPHYKLTPLKSEMLIFL